MAQQTVVRLGVVESEPVLSVNEALLQAEEQAIMLEVMADMNPSNPEVVPITQVFRQCAKLIRNALEVIQEARRKSIQIDGRRGGSHHNYAHGKVK